jgi:GMP synthase (glutamine-hydrolysing)
MTHQKPVLFIMHRQESEPGAIGHWLAQKGVPADIRRPRFGDPLPETLAGHQGAILFGGPMSANDPNDFVRREIEWIRVPLTEGKPFLGICLGAQMLAKHLGASVYCRSDARVEVGYEPISPSEAGASLYPWPSHVYHWHGEGFGLSAGAQALAFGTVFENQAFRFGKAFGVQFHPEITLAMIRKWTARASERMAQPGAQPASAHIEGHARHGAALRRWTFEFLDRWLAPGDGPQEQDAPRDQQS